MRHDFRAYYGCSYDEVSVEEAIDLIRTLPDGSLYVADRYPRRAWSDWKHALADIQDQISLFFYLPRGVKVQDIPRVVRPKDVIDAKEARESAAQVRKRIQNTTWEGV